MGAIIAGIFGLAVRWVPRTPTETQLDIATTRKMEAESWADLVSSLREEVLRLRTELREERERLAKLEETLENQQRELKELRAKISLP